MFSFGTLMSYKRDINHFLIINILTSCWLSTYYKNEELNKLLFFDFDEIFHVNQLFDCLLFFTQTVNRYELLGKLCFCFEESTKIEVIHSMVVKVMEVRQAPLKCNSLLDYGMHKML